MSTKSEKGRRRMAGDYTMRMAPHILMSVSSQFDYMDDFRNFTLNAIEREKKRIEERYETTTKGMTEEEIERHSEWASEDYAIVKEFFSEVSLQSFLIILYSHVESGLNRLCDALFSDQSRLNEKEGKEPLKIRYVNMHGKTINRAKLYLEKVFNVDLHTGEQPWEEIDALRKIRNAIVHDEGWANEGLAKNRCVIACIDKSLLELEERRGGELGKIVIKPGYLEWVIRQAKTFFENIDLKN